MLFKRIREAAYDPLTGRIALCLFGIVLVALSIFAATSQRVSNNSAYVMAFGISSVLGLYLIAVSLFRRKPRAVAILLNYATRPLGVPCLVLAIALKSAAQRLALIGRERQ